MAAVATGNEIERARLRRVQRCAQRIAAGHGDRRRRQTGAGIGVVRRILFQIAQPQVAVKARSQTINHRRIGLQLHALAQPVYEHAGDQRALVRAPGFLFDNRGQNQRLVRRLQRQVRFAVFPLARETLAHFFKRLGEDRMVLLAGGIIIGIGIKPAFGVHIGVAQPHHDFLRRQTGKRAREFRRLVKRGDHLAKCPTLDKAYWIFHDASDDDLFENARGARPGGKAVFASLELAALPRQGRAPDKGYRLDDHATAAQLLGHATQRRALLEQIGLRARIEPMGPVPKLIGAQAQQQRNDDRACPPKQRNRHHGSLAVFFALSGQSCNSGFRCAAPATGRSGCWSKIIRRPVRVVSPSPARRGR